MDPTTNPQVLAMLQALQGQQAPSAGMAPQPGMAAMQQPGVDPAAEAQAAQQASLGNQQQTNMYGAMMQQPPAAPPQGF